MAVKGNGNGRFDLYKIVKCCPCLRKGFRHVFGSLLKRWICAIYSCAVKCG